MTDDDLPMPPNDLLVLITGLPDYDPAEFLRVGAGLADNVRTLVKAHGGDLETCGPVLDFGCGCGRTIRHLRGLNERLYGTDYDPRLVQWCRAQLPFATFSVNDAMPPLDYRTGMFGCVYSFSVFTHFTVAQQQAWMAEMVRVLAPGGFLVLSTQGAAFARYLPAEEQQRFEADELVVLREDAAGEASCMAYHSQEALATVAEGFDLVEFRPGRHDPERPERLAQDISLLRRR